MTQQLVENRSLVERAAAFWAAADFADMPSDGVHAAKRHLLDTLAAAIAGARSAAVDSVLRAFHHGMPAGGGAGILWGRDECVAPTVAALVNGTAAHALELDDFGGCGHSGAAVIPAVLAAAALRPAPGRDLLLAIIAGYDIASRTLEAAGGYAAHNQRGWHSTATCGTFGAAAGAAVALRLDETQFADALGVGGTFVGGVWAFLADGALTKRIHGGKAAESGLAAALMAREGLTGPHHIFEAPWGGFLDCYARETRCEAAFQEGLGEEFHILRSGLKPYPCCRGIHSVLDGLTDIMSSDHLSAEDIEGFIVHGDAHTIRQLGKADVATLFEAQFSIPYCLAVTAVDGALTLPALEAVRVSEPKVRRLIAATQIKPDRDLGRNGHPDLTVILRNGAELSRATPFPKGDPRNPLSDGELLAKAQGLIGPVLGTDHAGRLIDTIMSLDTLPDCTRLFDLLQAGPASANRI